MTITVFQLVKPEPENEPFKPCLKLHRGGKYPFNGQRISDFWAFCHSSIWQNEHFSKQEVDVFKLLIADHFISSNQTTDQIFSALIRRVVLALRYVKGSDKRYFSRPMEWLNINNINGLSGTKKWMDSIDQKRLLAPQYEEGLFILSKAIKTFSKKFQARSFTHAHKKLLKAKEYDLLPLLITGIVYIEYLND